MNPEVKAAVNALQKQFTTEHFRRVFLHGKHDNLFFRIGAIANPKDATREDKYLLVVWLGYKLLTDSNYIAGVYL